MQTISKDQVNTFLSSVDTFLIDCDGVLWNGNIVVDGVKEVLQNLRKLGKRICFVTNNATKTRQEYIQKFIKVGLEAYEDEIYGSAYVAAQYLKQRKFSKKVFVIGEQGLQEELTLAGISNFTINSSITELPIDTIAEQGVDPDVEAVLVGFDKNFNYPKIAYASLCLRYNETCEFLATNADETFVIRDKQMPGGGTMVGALQVSSPKKVKILGKPFSSFFDVIDGKYHLNKERTCMIGDRLNTDVLFGINSGIKTLLVLTGVTTKDMVLSEENKIYPDFIINSLGDLK